MAVNVAAQEAQPSAKSNAEGLKEGVYKVEVHTEGAKANILCPFETDS